MKDELLTGEALIYRGIGYGLRIMRRGGVFALSPVAFLLATLFALFSGKRLYFYEMGTQHLGGWALILDAFLRRTKAGITPQGVHIFLVNRSRISNRYFYQLMKRQVLVVDNPLVYWVLLPLTVWKNRYRGGALTYLTHSECYPPIEWFTREEIEAGRALLRDFGLADDDWYACFFARDDGYTNKTASRTEKYSYLELHNCRNADISNYEEAMKYVVAKGGRAFRVGKYAAKKLSLEDDRIIDYPFSGLASDFLDVFLVCHARFIVGTGSGVVDLSSIMNVPLAVADYMYYDCPYGVSTDTGSRRPFVYIPKLLKYVSEGRNLRLDEYTELVSQLSMPPYRMRPFLNGLASRGLQYEDNVSEDIVMLTRKIWNMALPDHFCGNAGDDTLAEAVAGAKVPVRYSHMLPEFIAKHGLCN